MSFQPASEPICRNCDSSSPVETVIEGASRDLDGFDLRRILPSESRRLIGPFIFFDHMGPATIPPGEGINVRPHPHINLATVTYLFEGEIVHRDSLGSHQAISPGAINWMTAGCGIVHSERTGDEERARESRLHGIQLWVALPKEHEETEPAFDHYPAEALPGIERDGARLRVLAGSAYDLTSPVRTLSPLFYVEALLPAGVDLPMPDGHHDRAAYVAEGSVRCGPERGEVGQMLVFSPGSAAILKAETESRVMLLGGAPLDGKRHIWWNFVSSRRERIEQAKSDWKEGRFPMVPGDEEEFIPLPE